MIIAEVSAGHAAIAGIAAEPERFQRKTARATEETVKQDFAELVDPHQDALFAGALQFTGNRADAEDLLQETFMRAYIGFKRSQEIEKPRAWLFKIMRNAYINRYHKKRRQPAKVSYEEGLDHKVDEVFSHAQADPQDAFFSQFLDKEIEEALDSLPEQFRESVVLCDISGLSYEEISNVLACPLGTVRSRISRGRELLFHKLYDYARDRGLLRLNATA
jgi:RNA polymerase sigma-70 factor (ECF subfamily)